MLKKTKQARAEKTRDSLVRAAIDTVYEGGYENARIQDIAHRAGVTPGAILYHFKNLETLLMEAFRSDFEILMDDFEPGSADGLSSEVILHRMAGLLDNPAFRNRIGVLTEYLIAARNDPSRQQLIEEVMGANRTRLVAVAEQLIGRTVDGDRLWGIIDVAVSLLIAAQLRYPSAAQSHRSYEVAKPFLLEQLRAFLDEHA
ncbi:MAG: TetR/AcrR family transcriptional regulator [Pseudomonadota bacterium]